jgi:hypothetical protein
MVAIADWILTPKSAIIILSSGPPVTILSDDPRYAQAKDLIRSGKLEDLLLLADKGAAIETRSEGKFTVVDGVITIDGETLPRALSGKLLELVEAGEDTLPLENFWDNLRQNPSESARESLYSFLKANNVPITNDGCIIVYKMVLENYFDSHTGRTYINKPGSIITMPREDVDADRNSTCSRGLHVAAYEYAKDFTGRRLMECKVHPKDVVAVPTDYNDQKMRVCRYQVLRETKEKYVAPVYHAAEVEAAVPQLVEPEVKETLVLSTDSEGRIRVPGSLIRKTLRVGVGRRVSVFVEDGCLTLWRGNKKDGADNHYIAQSDNCIRISKRILDLASDSTEWAVELRDESIVLSPNE